MRNASPARSWRAESSDVNVHSKPPVPTFRPSCGCKSPPVAKSVFGFDDNDVVFFKQWNMILVQVVFEEFSFIELISHLLAAFQVLEKRASRKRVGIFDREKLPKWRTPGTGATPSAKST
jgi:hypothetical protein